MSLLLGLALATCPDPHVGQLVNGSMTCTRGAPGSNTCRGEASLLTSEGIYGLPQTSCRSTDIGFPTCTVDGVEVSGRVQVCGEVAEAGQTLVGSFTDLPDGVPLPTVRRATASTTCRGVADTTPHYTLSVLLDDVEGGVRVWRVLIGDLESIPASGRLEDGTVGVSVPRRPGRRRSP